MPSSSGTASARAGRSEPLPPRDAQPRWRGYAFLFFGHHVAPQDDYCEHAPARPRTANRAIATVVPIGHNDSRLRDVQPQDLVLLVGRKMSCAKNDLCSRIVHATSLPLVRKFLPDAHAVRALKSTEQGLNGVSRAENGERDHSDHSSICST